MSKDNSALRSIDSPIYRYWQALYCSFYDRNLYVDVGKRWKGFGLIYFLILMFLVTLPVSFRLMGDFNRFFNEDLIHPIEQLPPLIIQNGQISLDKPMPYLIKNKAGQVVSIVDTTGTITKMDPAYPFLQTLITKKKLLYRFPTPQFTLGTVLPATPPEGPVSVYSFNEYTNAVFDGKYWLEFSGIRKIGAILKALIYPATAMIFFGIFATLLLAFAMMGQFIARFAFRFIITYKQSCRLLAVSVTPFMVILWIVMFANVLLAGLGIFLILLFAFYFSFAVISLKNESNKLVNL